MGLVGSLGLSGLRGHVKDSGVFSEDRGKLSVLFHWFSSSGQGKTEQNLF